MYFALRDRFAFDSCVGMPKTRRSWEIRIAFRLCVPVITVIVLNCSTAQPSYMLTKLRAS
ncbi:hypothetical protein PAXRUDRAFT_221935 [Paxillus rubicundulus Ve08.2h10]|uniref:Uncharacterized protein n=1 Tax=Paxillus rubicundulus Ve08.2h10 TaxID=930991 RepID=A0A0D0DA35_9AGAM|nr:hypothetical protein PAXRUDRAFT_221935 [Paxillus rubicundulus Ve08.2h10]